MTLLDLSTGEAIGTLDLGESPDVAQAAERVGSWLAAAARGEAPARTPRLLPDWRSPDAVGAAGPPTAEIATPLRLAAAADRPEEARPWYRRWYWWALIGVGMAAGAAALAAGGGGGGSGGGQTGSVTVGP